MKRLLVAVGASLSFLGLILPVQAQATRAIPASAARGQGPVVTIDLHPGHGTTLNFRPTGETVRRVWLDDPSQVTLDFDDTHCLSIREQGDCTANVIHLRRIHRLNFPNLPATPTTLLTVLSDRHLYQFRLAFPETGSPRYYTLEIQPDRDHPLSTTRVASRIRGESGAQAIERGLQVAESRRLITRGDALWNRLRSLIRSVGNGTSVVEAARQSGVSQALIARLVELGLQASSP
jgi:hypothetical protein